MSILPGSSAKLGDAFVGLFRDLADNDFYDRRMLADFARRLNIVERYALQSGSALDAPNQLSPDILTLSEPFTVLPHEVASLRFNTQEIASGTTFATPTVADPSGATWTHGFSIDKSAGTISVDGQDKNAVIGFVLWWQWAGNSTGRRALRWNDVGGGNAVQDFEFSPDATVATYLHIPHVRRVAAADTTYRLQVYQNSGVGLNGDGLLVAYRIR